MPKNSLKESVFCNYLRAFLNHTIKAVRKIRRTGKIMPSSGVKSPPCVRRLSKKSRPQLTKVAKRAKNEKRETFKDLEDIGTKKKIIKISAGANNG